MIPQHKDEDIRRLVERLSELKRRRAALTSEVAEIERILDAAGRSLRQVNSVKAFADGCGDDPTMSREDVSPVAYPPAERVNALFDELRDVARELRDTRERLKDTWVDLD